MNSSTLPRFYTVARMTGSASSSIHFVRFSVAIVRPALLPGPGKRKFTAPDAGAW